jgi:phosphoribosyl 1,2-cyclic phosphodiesterase
MEIKVLASGSSGNAYYVTDGKTPLLLEAGIPFRKIQEALDYNTSDIAACLVTHEHKDHCIGVPDVLKRGIKVYMSEGTAKHVETGLYKPQTLKPKEVTKIGSWRVLPFDVQHDVSEPLGYLLTSDQGEKLLFATDTYYIRYRVPGLTHIMIECNYSEAIVDERVASGHLHPVQRKRLRRSHMSLENAVDFFKANDLSAVQEIHLLHLSDGNSNEKEFKDTIQSVTGKPVYIA